MPEARVWWNSRPQAASFMGPTGIDAWKCTAPTGPTTCQTWRPEPKGREKVYLWWRNLLTPRSFLPSCPATSPSVRRVSGPACSNQCSCCLPPSVAFHPRHIAAGKVVLHGIGRVLDADHAAVSQAADGLAG